MNLDQVRLGALFVPTTALWTGSVSSWDGDTFTLTVSTSTGALSDVSAGLAVVWEGQYIRIRAVDAGAGTLTLAETGAGIESGDPVVVYAPRLPFPRYQYIDSDGTVYKDRDVAWTSAAATLPPRAWIWVENPSGDGGYSEAIWVPVGETRTVNALASLVMSAEATTGVLTYQWASDADATIAAPTSSETTVSWSSAGFRYLKLTVTDDQSVSTVRYIPVWVGNANLVDARALSLDWDAARGWRAQVQLDSLTTYLRGAPVAIVDLETADVVTLGWHYPGAWRQDFEVTDVEFELRGAFGYADAIYAYPFIIEDTDSPSEWAHVSELTLERAVWYLLYWHSTLPQLANVGPGTAPDNRRIAGQEFTAGTLADQLTELNEAAFRYVTGYRSGGFTLYEHPLYMTETEFTGLTSIDLSAQTALGETLEIEQAQPTVAEARLSGVYYGVGDAQFKPIIARGPTHPLPWGNTEEVTNLAPTSQAEILQWAARYIALRNTADRYTVRPHTLDVQPADGRVVDLPDGVRIALEEVHLTYNVDALAWDAEVVGRTFGSDVSVAVEPPPPAIEPPEPPAPPPEPPLPPIPPAYEWGDGNVAAFAGYDGQLRVWVTQNLLDASPIWTEVTGNLSLGAYPWSLVFAQGGTYPMGLYLLPYNGQSVWYCAAPLESATWAEIVPPYSEEFEKDHTFYWAPQTGMRPHLRPHPGADGRILTTLQPNPGGDNRMSPWVLQDGAPLHAPVYVGKCGRPVGWSHYAEEAEFAYYWVPNAYRLVRIPIPYTDLDERVDICGENGPDWILTHSRVPVPWRSGLLGLGDDGASVYLSESEPCTATPLTGVPVPQWYGYFLGRHWGKNPRDPYGFLAWRPWTDPRLNDSTTTCYTDDAFATVHTVPDPTFANLGRALPQALYFPGDTTADTPSYLLNLWDASQGTFRIALYNLTTAAWVDKTGNLSGVAAPSLSCYEGRYMPHALDVFWGERETEL